MLYISYIAPIVSSPHPLLASLKAIARGFFVLFHTGEWSPLTIYPHLNLLHSHFLLPHNTPHPHCTYFTVLSFVISVFKLNVQRGFWKYPHCGYSLLWSTQSLSLLSLTSLPSTTPHFSTAFNKNLHHLPLQMFYDTTDVYHSLFLSHFPWIP
jgi:hypothetical protein